MGFTTRTRTSFCSYSMRMRENLPAVEGTGTAARSTSRYVLCTATSALNLPSAKRCNIVLLISRKVAVCKSTNHLDEQGREKKMVNAEDVRMRVLNTL
jgi:hypothetical protein